MPEWSWATWVTSAAFVVVSGCCAWCEGNWRRHARLDIGFAEHGGMWGDLALLPIANAVIVPWLRLSPWLLAPIAIGIATTWWLHGHWHRGGGGGAWREHMWPVRTHARWTRNLSWAGWLHVIYVAAEMALLVAYAITPVPLAVIAIVTIVLTLHVPLGLYAPAWVATGGRLVANPLLWPALVIVWIVALVKAGLTR